MQLSKCTSSLASSIVRRRARLLLSSLPLQQQQPAHRLSSASTSFMMDSRCATTRSLSTMSDHNNNDLTNRGKSSSSSFTPNETSTTTTTTTSYVSPLQEFWDNVQANRTTLQVDDGDKNSADDDDASSTTTTTSTPKLLKCGIPETALRFTTTSYGRTMNAPFVHSQEHQVTLKVNLNALPLQNEEWNILQEIVGSQRLNVQRNELRLTSDQFGSRMENKRHLVSMLDRIILSCQRLGHELHKSTSTTPLPSSSEKSSNQSESNPDERMEA